jgi:hypothetical protein
MSDDWAARLRAVPKKEVGVVQTFAGGWETMTEPDYAAMGALVATALREAIAEREAIIRGLRKALEEA